MFRSTRFALLAAILITATFPSLLRADNCHGLSVSGKCPCNYGNSCGDNCCGIKTAAPIPWQLIPDATAWINGIDSICQLAVDQVVQPYHLNMLPFGHDFSLDLDAETYMLQFSFHL